MVVRRIPSPRSRGPQPRRSDSINGQQACEADDRGSWRMRGLPATRTPTYTGPMQRGPGTSSIMSPGGSCGVKMHNLGGRDRTVAPTAGTASAWWCPGAQAGWIARGATHRPSDTREWNGSDEAVRCHLFCKELVRIGSVIGGETRGSDGYRSDTKPQVRTPIDLSLTAPKPPHRS